MALLRLRTAYEDTRLEQACQRALASGDGRYRTVQHILERGLEVHEMEEPIPQVTRAFLRGPQAFVLTPASEETPWPR